ncbi:MAG: hypothetical protein FJ023_09420 [Chloroflexi bacterium]|nr:hypothetical protein [Chloroflexota bacterium]
MGRFRRETRRFKRRAINSLLLAIELFNRPHEVGRTEAVLILLQHSFEMLLKAAIYEARGIVSESKGSFAYRFDKCIGIAKGDLHVLDEDESRTLSILDGLRDCSAHNLIDLSEQALYIHTQAAVTLFDRLLDSVFSERLADHMPTRVLPITTSPPKDMITFMDTEFTQIQELLHPRKKRKAEARGKLRHLMIMESNLVGDSKQPTDRDVSRVMQRVKKGDTWQRLFPGIAMLRLDTQGHALTISLRFTRQPEAAPVRLIREGEPDFEQATLVREVNLLDRYSMRLNDLAQSLGLTSPRTLALVRHLKLQGEPACYKEFRLSKSSIYKRYSPQALCRLREALSIVDLQKVWEKCGSRVRRAAE